MILDNVFDYFKCDSIWILAKDDDKRKICPVKKKVKEEDNLH